MTYFIFYTILTIALEVVYFKSAGYFQIIDKPNVRSSHDSPVIRGGGVIFIGGILIWFFSFSFQWPYFVVGAAAIALISFVDDLKAQSALLRFFVHLSATLLLFYQVDFFLWGIGLLILAGIVCIGTLNAYNFMDGINGITGINAMVFFGTCIYIHSYIIPYTDLSLLISLVISVLIFLYFNFRKKAMCFAGDVGSVTLAYAQIFLLLQLIQKTGSLFWAGMFFVFGIDSVVTIIYRIKRKENIFKPHRTHLYQFLSNELKWDHRLVSVVYGAVQLMVNTILIASIQSGNIWMLSGFGALVLTIYLVVRAGVTRRICVSAANLQ